MYEISSLFTHGFKLVDVSNWYKSSVSLRQQNSLPGGRSIHLLLRRRKSLYEQEGQFLLKTIAETTAMFLEQ